MLVQRVLMPDSGVESWTVLGDDHVPVEPVERWLAFLTAAERSPNTVKGYAHDLKDWFCYLAGRGLDWREVRLEDLGGFVAWLRLPPEGRDGLVLLLPSARGHLVASSINRKLSALSAFYEFHARHGLDLGELLTTWRPYAGARTAWKPFLHHVARQQPQRQRTIKLKTPKPAPRLLTAQQVQAILDACDRLRDRLLLAVLHDSGIRIGEALGLRHEDLAVAEQQLTVTPRHNDNGARTKSVQPRPSRSAQS
jgi:integrase/recombinase XerD